MNKTAVVLFNLGGPDSLKAVKPFLFNVFNDPAIITLPQPLRWIAAKIFSTLRAGKAQAIYQRMGGKSPITDISMAQAEALEKKLKGNGEYKVFVSMRHWHPMSDLVAKKVKAYAPDNIILLPLYPQFSTTTTGSSFSDWDDVSETMELDIPTKRVCCYPSDRGFVAAHVKLIKDMYWKASEHGVPRLLFSAHGLPEKTIANGDPYQWQVEKTADAIVQVLAIDDLDHSVCYQSKVGPLEWIGPSTHEEIVRAGEDKVPVLVIPVAFVSEHSETLVELDVDYRKLAESAGVPGYYRVPALGTDDFFIDALADLCKRAEGSSKSLCAHAEGWSCPVAFTGCAMHEAE